jgi:hypothetical protein
VLDLLPRRLTTVKLVDGEARIRSVNEGGGFFAIVLRHPDFETSDIVGQPRGVCELDGAVWIDVLLTVL